MLISALCRYYDVLARDGHLAPEGFEFVELHYVVHLTPEGSIDFIQDVRTERNVQTGKDKNGNPVYKMRSFPMPAVFPQRTQKPGVDSSFIEHRPMYLFGLNYVVKTGLLSPNDRTSKAKKSRDILVSYHLPLLEGLSSPTIDAFRNFLLSWNPADETENAHLRGLDKAAWTSGRFAFCLTGHPDALLQDDPLIRARWESLCGESGEVFERQCAVLGETLPLARLHRKIRGLHSGHATGNVLISFDGDAESSYGYEQSYNSNISQQAMLHYTEALNYLLLSRERRSQEHKARLDDMTVVFWAADGKPAAERTFNEMLFGIADDAEDTEQDASHVSLLLSENMQAARRGALTYEQVLEMNQIDPNVDFYVLGLKSNVARISVKFLYHRRFGDIFKNIAQHQADLKMYEAMRPVSMHQLEQALLHQIPRSNAKPDSGESSFTIGDNESLSPALRERIFESVLFGTPYPSAMLIAVVQRIKTDTGIKISATRAGIIKAYLNRIARRDGNKEEITMPLDLKNKHPAYLCGRLFATLEMLQQTAAKSALNRTIKDAYFSAATARPGAVFPRLNSLAQNHLKTIDNKGTKVFYDKMIQEICDDLNGEFPAMLTTADQGRFIIGYYQQIQDFYRKRSDKSAPESTADTDKTEEEN